MSTKNFKLKRTIVVLVSLALLLMPNFIVFADGADDAPTAPETEQTSGDEEQPGDDESGGGDEEQPGDDESGSGDEEQPGDDESGGGDEEQPGDDESGGGDEEQPGDDESGGDEEQPPSDIGPMLQSSPMALNGWGDKTLTLSKTGNGKFHVTVYHWQNSGPGGGSWGYWYDFDSDGGSHNINKYAKVKVEAIGTNGDDFKSWSSTPSNASTSGNTTEFEMNDDNRSASAVFGSSIKYKRLTFLDFPNGLDYYTYDYDGGSGQKDGGEYIDVPQGTKVTVTAHACSCWHQTGWQHPHDPSNTGAVVITLNGNNQVQATFAEDVVYRTLSVYNADGLDYFTLSYGSTTDTVYVSGNYTTVTIPDGTSVTATAYAQSNWEFNQWIQSPPTDRVTNGSQVSFTLDQDSNLSASFSPSTYTLSFQGSHCYYTVDGGTTQYRNGDTKPIDKNESVEVTAHPDNGYYFSGWDYKPSDATGSNPITFTMNDDKYVDAKINSIQYGELRFYPEPGLASYSYSWTYNGLSGSGTINSYPDSGYGGSCYKFEAPVGASVSVTANNDSGHIWISWRSTPGTSGNPTSFTMPSDGWIQAEMEEIPNEHALTLYNNDGLDYYTYSVDGGTAQTKYISGSSGTVNIPGDKQVVLRAYAKNTHSNNGWPISPEGATAALDNMVEFVMDGDKSAKAGFSRDYWILKFISSNHIDHYSYEINGGDETTAAAGSEILIPVDANVTVTAHPAAGFAFSQWNALSTPPSSGQSFNKWSFIMNSDHTIKADAVKLEGEKFQVRYDDMLGTGSGSIKVYYPDNTYVTTLREGQSVDINYVSGKNTVKVEALSSDGSSFVKWSNYNITSNIMEINLITGQPSSAAGRFSIECVVTINISLKPEFEKLGSLTITKVDEDYTSKKLAGAQFTLSGGPDSLNSAKSTGSDGKVSWENLKEGLYTLKETSAPTGYALPSPNQWSVTIGANGNVASIESSLDDWDVSATIENKAIHCSLTVTKVDGSDNTISSAEATFVLKNLDTGNSLPAKDTVNGVATWTDLIAGEYELTETSAPTGYYWQTQTHNITLKPTEANWPTFTKSVTNYEYASVKVVKKDQADEPMEGVTFTLTNTAGTVNMQAQTNSSGEIIWDDLKPGDYTVTETVPDGYYIVDPNFESFSLSNGQVKTVNFKNYEYASIKVVKTDQADEPMEGVAFTLTNTAGTVNMQAQTNSSGEIIWDDLKPGDYTVTETVPDGYYMEDPSFEEFSLSNGQVKTVNFKNYEYASLKIVKGVNDQSPMPNVTFTLATEDGTIILSGKTNAIGEIIIQNLKAGKYIVTETLEDGYYLTVDNPQTVTLDFGDEKTVNFMNYEYVEVYAMKQDINTGAALAGAEFAIFNYDNGTLGSQIGASQFTNGLGIARFGIEYELKANMTYWIKEVGAPYGYQNDAATANGYAVTINEYGANNESDPVLFENTPILQSINVVKQIEGTPAGTLVDGTTFELYVSDGGTYVKKAEATLTNGTCSFDSLVPGDYKVVEVAGDTVKFFTLAADETLTLELVGEETSTTVVMNNTFTPASFTLVKHDSLNAATVLSGAVYELTGMQWTGSAFAEQTFRLTTAGGSASVTGLTPGVYTLREVTAPTGYDIDPTVYTIDIMPGRSIEETYDVADDKLGAIILAKFEQGGTVNRVNGARFSLYRVVGGTRTFIRSGVTDANGNIVFDFLPAGDYVLVETAAPTGYNILGNGETAVTGLRVAERRTVLAFNGIVIVPPPPPAAPENLIVAAPPATPTPTPTPINTDEVIIEDTDPAFGPETGEGDALFISIGALLLVGIGLFLIKKRIMIKHK